MNKLRPLVICGGPFTINNVFIKCVCELDTVDHKVREPVVLTIKCSDMPPLAVIYQCMRCDLAALISTRQREVLNL